MNKTVRGNFQAGILSKTNLDFSSFKKFVYTDYEKTNLGNTKQNRFAKSFRWS